MKNLLILIVLLVCLHHETLSQTKQRLPKPTKAQAADDRIIDKGFIYLEANFKKEGEKETLQTFTNCKENCICSWEQQFQHGITYTFNNCHENGFDIKITFQHHDSAEIIKLVNTLFKTDKNEWNSEMTIYGPKKEGAVECHFKISKENDVSVLQYYCAC
jgi:hypothetical protein